MSTYTLTATEYNETRSAPVTVDGGRIQFEDPFGTRALVFEGNKMTATAEGNVDVWEKVL